MKYFILILVIFSCGVKASTPRVCDQHLYDAIYKKITQEALEDYQKAQELERAASMKKADNIESLKRLCNGQKSTYETGGEK